MLKHLIILFLLSMVLNAKSEPRVQIIMSTFVTISADERYNKEIENGFNIFKAVESSLSSYDNKAKIFLLNKNKKITLDKYTYEALTLSTKYYKKTNKYFDITVGSITKDIFKFGDDERVPLVNELKNAKLNFNALHFNEKEAYLENGIKIDLGGMGKGYAVDKVVKYFIDEGITDAIISASGDIRCLRECKINIQDPFSDGILMSLKTTKNNIGISTSGTYNRYIKTQKNNHLINPKLKLPQTKFISITLVSELLNADLDAYATAASVMPVKEAYEFLNSIDVAYIVVQNNAKVISGGNLSLIESNAIKK